MIYIYHHKQKTLQCFKSSAYKTGCLNFGQPSLHCITNDEPLFPQHLQCCSTYSLGNVFSSAFPLNIQSSPKKWVERSRYEILRGLSLIGQGQR